MNNVKVIIKNNTRIYLTDATKVAQSAIDLHNTSPFSSLVLAKAIATFGPVGIMKKIGDTFINYKTTGPIKLINLETNTNGEVRALLGNSNIITQYDADVAMANTLPTAVATQQNGTIKVVYFDKNNKAYGGEVEIVRGDLSLDLSYYFQQSEQVLTAVDSFSELSELKVIGRAWSVIYQMMPDHSEEDVEWVEGLLDKKLKDFKSIQDYIDYIGGDLIEEKTMIWKCKCDKEKMKKALETLTNDEREDIIKSKEKLEVVCNYCNNRFDFTNEKW